MQGRKDLEAISVLRRDLRRHLGELRGTVKAVFGRSSLVKGNVYEMARKCGKPSCACARGELHRSMVLSWSHRGKTRIMSIPSERLAEVQRKSGEYLKVRRARARVTTLYKEILALMDRIEKLRIEEP